MTQDESRGAANAGKRAGTLEAERREKLTKLVLRRSKLTPAEAALLREVFSIIVAAHHDLVWNLLRRRGLESHEAEDLLQEVFLALYNHTVETGFPTNLPGMLHTLTDRKAIDHVRARNRSPFSIGLPSSSSEKPRSSQLDIERALHFQEIAQRTFPQLSPEHQEAIDMVVLKGLTHTDAAAALGIPEGTLKSRLIAAKLAFLAIVETLLPPSQREPL